jgi:hypothetical protein
VPGHIKVAINVVFGALDVLFVILGIWFLDLIEHVP